MQLKHAEEHSLLQDAEGLTLTRVIWAAIWAVTQFVFMFFFLFRKGFIDFPLVLFFSLITNSLYWREGLPTWLW